MKIESRENWLSNIISNISDEDLCYMIEEISEFRRTGVLSDNASKLKEVNKQAADICKTSYSEVMRMTEDAVLFESARRYHNQINK